MASHQHPDRTREKARTLHVRAAGRAQLTLARIVEVGIAIADEGGVPAVSMARLADRLGHATMALYRHVDGKEQLLRLMQDAVWETPPPRDGHDWKARAREWAMHQVALLSAHPWLLDLPIPPADMPGQLALVEAGLAALAETALPMRERLVVLMLLSGTARSLVAAARDLSGADAARATLEVASEEGFERVQEAAREGAFDGSYSDVVAFSISTVLDGVEVRLSNRA